MKKGDRVELINTSHIEVDPTIIMWKTQAFYLRGTIDCVYNYIEPTTYSVDWDFSEYEKYNKVYLLSELKLIK